MNLTSCHATDCIATVLHAARHRHLGLLDVKLGSASTERGPNASGKIVPSTRDDGVIDDVSTDGGSDDNSDHDDTSGSGSGDDEDDGDDGDGAGAGLRVSLEAPEGTLEDNLADMTTDTYCSKGWDFERAAEDNDADMNSECWRESWAQEFGEDCQDFISMGAIKRAALMCHGSIPRFIALLCRHPRYAFSCERRGFKHAREYARLDRLLAFRRCHDAHLDAGMVVRTAAHGRPMELGMWLIKGALAGGLDITGEVEDGAGGTRVVGPLEAARLGGHDECVKVLQDAYKTDDLCRQAARGVLVSVLDSFREDLEKVYEIHLKYDDEGVEDGAEEACNALERWMRAAGMPVE